MRKVEFKMTEEFNLVQGYQEERKAFFAAVPITLQALIAIPTHFSSFSLGSVHVLRRLSSEQICSKLSFVQRYTYRFDINKKRATLRVAPLLVFWESIVFTRSAIPRLRM